MPSALETEVYMTHGNHEHHREELEPLTALLSSLERSGKE
jgi:hypothetical protein